MYEKCTLRRDGGKRDSYFALPEREIPNGVARNRFDVVDEKAPLWTPEGHDKPCRPVIELRGFVEVHIADTAETYQIAIGRNLVPHSDAEVDSGGNPVHPMWRVLHCRLAQLAVLTSAVRCRLATRGVWVPRA